MREAVTQPVEMQRIQREQKAHDSRVSERVVRHAECVSNGRPKAVLIISSVEDRAGECVCDGLRNLKISAEEQRSRGTGSSGTGQRVGYVGNSGACVQTASRGEDERAQRV